MGTVSHIVVPFMLVLARVSGLFAVLPIFGWLSAPVRVRAGLALMISIVFASVLPAGAPAPGGHWLAVGVLLVREVATGVALGLAVALAFGAVRQTGLIIKRQMGLAVAQEIDPMTGEQSQPVGLLMEMCFAVFFLAAGGHRLMLRLVARSYEVFPIGQGPTAAAMTEAVMDAGVVMLTFALKLAAPMVGAFLVLAVALAILARILPEMNILMASLPLRVGLGLFVAAAIMPSLQAFTVELGDWLNRFLVT
ncbi:MAG: hypothetical protein AMK72_03415 [Planctomycetes bacterium SM23_25]|nr:MAG: hypothetical protein AMS14_06005 [Planctomycetes bacterium DG_20]KPK49887.1 MAG: hypothetical protein AMK72_03415 [Planctomycetes bacterium SM23_25]